LLTCRPIPNLIYNIFLNLNLIKDIIKY